jgi:hypothetical protein
MQGSNKKIFNKKSLKYFAWTPLGSRVFSSSSLEGVTSVILFPLFATGVIDIGCKFVAICNWKSSKKHCALPKKFTAPLVIHSEFLHRTFANPCTM